MATSITPDAQNEEWAEPRVSTRDPGWSRAEWLWTLFGVALFCLFLAFVVIDYPLQTLISAQ
jgi:hypothetical protein